MRKARLVKSTVAIALSAAMLAGCGGGSSSTGSGDSGNTTTTAAAAGGSSDNSGGGAAAPEASGEEVSITVMVWDRGNAAPGTTPENNTLTDYIKQNVKEKYNINVEYVSVPRSSSDDKVNIMMAGGNAPDIIFTYSQNLFNNFAQNGGLADLTAAYEAYGTNLKQNQGEIQSMGQYDGKQYAILKQRGLEMPRHLGFIRKDWLDAMGMEIPKTKEELAAYLQAVKDQNPGGVDKVIPWAMSGRADTEKNYLAFISSYADLPTDKDAYVYNESYITVAPGAVDGIRKLNEFYNAGLISQDFATDTTEDIYKAQVSAGNVGFFVDDTGGTSWDLMSILYSATGKTAFVPVQCFDLADGSYRSVFEPRYGMYVMVPKTSEAKAEACVKYLDWMSDPEVAENIAYTPEHERDEAGVPIALTEAQLFEKGYPGTLDDLSIVNGFLEWMSNKDSVVSYWSQSQAVEWESKDWFENYYDVMNVGKFRYPTYPFISDAEANYGKNIEDMMVEYVYRLISCSPSEFDALQQAEYSNLQNAGLQQILDARAEYYDANAK